MNLRRASICVALITACGKGTGTARDRPEGDARRHDDKSHDENHFYVAVTDAGFAPAVLEVPTQQDIILLFDRRPGAHCTAITLDMSPTVHRTFDLGPTAAEAHVSFSGRGSYGYACTAGAAHAHGVIKAS